MNRECAEADRNIAPELRPKADDEIRSSRSGSWFTDSGDCRGELLAFLRVQNVKLQVRMGGRSKKVRIWT